MIPIHGQPILTAAQMRAAEEAAAPTPDAMYALMERAGAGVAEAVHRLSAGAEALILCGPGNNGGDGYVAARILRERGHPVRLVALTPPRTSLARRAAAGWNGLTSFYTTGDQTRTDQPAWAGREPEPVPVLVDALFGTGGRESYECEPWVQAHRSFFESARFTIAVDLPLGVSVAGKHLFHIDFARADVTLALGAVKPAHVLPSSAALCGQVRVLDLGLDLADAPVRVVERPRPAKPDAKSHKFSRGVVGVVSGAMPGAARLAAIAAARAGAGYVMLFGAPPGGPASFVHKPLTEEALSDRRLDVVVVGPGLGRDDDARRRVEWLMRHTSMRLIVDGDALRILDPGWLDRRQGVVLTPHADEHRTLTERVRRSVWREGDPFGGKMAEAAALSRSAPVIVAKGATTVIADPFRAQIAPHGNPWLSTAGTGDVLAGTIAAMAAGRGSDSMCLLDAAAAGVWLHAEAARLCGASFTADDLAYALTPARALL